jgi:hypothetical protein
MNKKSGKKGEKTMSNKIDELLKEAHEYADKALDSADEKLDSTKSKVTNWLNADWSGAKNWHKVAFAVVAIILLLI